MSVGGYEYWVECPCDYSIRMGAGDDATNIDCKQCGRTITVTVNVVDGGDV